MSQRQTGRGATGTQTEALVNTATNANRTANLALERTARVGLTFGAFREVVIDGTDPPQIMLEFHNTQTGASVTIAGPL